MRKIFYISIGLVFTLIGLSLIFKHEYRNNELSSRVAVFSATISKLHQQSSKNTNFENQRNNYLAAIEQYLPPHSQVTVVDRASKVQLKHLYDKTYNYLLRSNDLSTLTFLENIFARLETKQWLNNDDIISMHRIYLMFRTFEKADSFRGKYPDQNLPIAPKNIVFDNRKRQNDPDIRPIIRTNLNKKNFELSEYNFSSYTGLVVIAHPECRFFRNFLKDIGNDPIMAHAFLENTLWLTDKGASLADGKMANWNQTMPNIQFQIVYSEADWPEINYWGSPSFYFFEKSKLVSKVVGWPRNQSTDRKTALKDSFQVIGIDLPMPKRNSQ